MPSNPIGYSFAPTFENAEVARSSGAGAQPQGPLQVLSYRLRKSPAVLGMSPLSTDQRSGVANSSVIESVLRTVLGPEAAAQFLASLQSGAPDFAAPGDTGSGGGPGNPFSGAPEAPGAGGAPPPRPPGGGGGGYERPGRSGPASPFGGAWSTPGTTNTWGDVSGGQKRGEMA